MAKKIKAEPYRLSAAGYITQDLDTGDAFGLPAALRGLAKFLEEEGAVVLSIQIKRDLSGKRYLETILDDWEPPDLDDAPDDWGW